MFLVVIVPVVTNRFRLLWADVSLRKKKTTGPNLSAQQNRNQLPIDVRSSIIRKILVRQERNKEIDAIRCL